MGRAFERRKHKMRARWDAMAKAFVKVGREISLAVKSGGPDPSTNARLRLAIQNAKGVNMPKDKVEGAIKRASSKSEEDLVEITYEGYAANGIAVVVECATNNPTRTVANVRSYFNRTGGSLGKTGSLEFLFSRKGVFTIKGEGLDLEELELELIDFGADEIKAEAEDNTVLIYTAYEDFGNMQKGLEEKSIEPMNASLQRIPHNTNKLTEAQEEDVIKLLDKLEEDEDVMNVFHNMSEEE